MDGEWEISLDKKGETHMNVNRSILATFSIAIILGTVHSLTAAEKPIVEKGQPKAEIVIAEKPPRTVKLAAEELQSHIEKISGAKLPIVTKPSKNLLHLYVGSSPSTDKLGVDDKGLENGAFRLKTVKDGLVLLGHDEDYTPKQPHTMSGGRKGPERERVYSEWDELSGGLYGNPRASRGRSRSKKMDLWAYDEGGSFNAVCEFLRRLGVRWYMAGDLGTIIPTLETIPLPDVDETVKPAFDWRQCAFAIYFSSPPSDILWYRRQGFNYGDKTIGHYSHGLRDVIARDELKEIHPEYYALVRGNRLTDRAHACLSSPELRDAAVGFARGMYDVYDLPMVSMMPQDGFQFCECQYCQGKDTPERGREGIHSDYVWGFVNDVASELYKTHPDRGVNCLAYGTYDEPPAKIDHLSPNVAVGIVHGRGKYFNDPETRKKTLALRDRWKKKTDHPFWTWEHYPFTHRSTFTPFYFPHSIADGIKSENGEFFGEFIEAPIGPFKERGHALHTPGFSHLNFYVTGRCQWDPNLDIDALLDEYYQKFYGPAAEEMKAFIEYSEANRRELTRDAKKVKKCLALLDAAAAKAKPDSVYGKRIALVVDYLKKLRGWGEQLNRGRENVPEIDIPVKADAKLKLDGRLDDAVWKDLPAHPLVDVKTGAKARVGTWFKLFWEGGEKQGHLVVGIHCDEPDMENLRMLTEKTGDWRVFGDDNVEVLFETQAHSYYQLAINASGAYVDLDRNFGKLNHAWSSLAQVASYRGKDFWSIEAKIPVTGEMVASDPLHEAAGKRPTEKEPWFIQIGRQRLRGPDKEWTCWSFTGKNFHDVMRFGKLK